MHIEDATAFIVEFIARPRAAAAYSDYGYDVYVPNVVAAHLADVEKIFEGVRDTGLRAMDDAVDRPLPTWCAR
jgi:hypothetical protein